MTDAKTEKPAEGTVAEKSNEVPLLFTEFSWFPLSLDVHYGYLAMKARPELWGLPDNPFVILDSYFIHTYIHTIKHHALAVSSDGEFCCFDTGLLTPRLAQIYAVFQKNKNKGFQSWFFKGWFDYTEVVGMNKFETIPNRPPFFNSPTDLFFDPRIELRLDPSNIKLDSDDKARLQKACPQTSLAALDEMLESRFERTKRLVMLSPRTAVPMYFPGSKSNQMLLLLPLHIVNMEYPDIAVAIEKVSDTPNADPNDYTKFYYRYVSLFSLPTAYKFARLLGRIESDWLTIPNQQIYSARVAVLQEQLSAVNEHRHNNQKKNEQNDKDKDKKKDDDSEWETIQKKNKK